MLWAAEAVALLAVLEAFLRRAPPGTRPAVAEPPPVRVAPGTPLAPLGERACLPPGLTEVAPAYLASLDGLAPGSAAMRAAQESFSAETGLPVEVRNSIGMRFRLVPPGTALLGSPPHEAGRGDAEHQHVFAVLAPFYLAACETTQEEWSRCMPENPSQYRGPRRPVEEVSWYDAQRFLAALCRAEGAPEGTYRLPTEQEWEYACRAGTATAYCCGDEPLALDAFATHAENGGQGTAVVDSKRPNALGLFEMHGNVWEWCQNRFAPYPGDDRPLPPEYRAWRALRGGNWYVPRTDCRSAERGRLPPASRGNMLGFRVLRAIPWPLKESPGARPSGAVPAITPSPPDAPLQGTREPRTQD